MGKAQLEQLDKHGSYLSVPRGVSMWPMIPSKQGIVEIRRLERPAKRYDVVMYTRPDGQGVIHRVLRVREKDYVIAGDNCWRREFVPREWVAGIAVRFYRKGKWYEMTHKGYLCYAHVWTDLFFIRGPLIFLRDQARAAAGKIKKTLRPGRAEASTQRKSDP